MFFEGYSLKYDNFSTTHEGRVINYLGISATKDGRIYRFETDEVHRSKESIVKQWDKRLTKEAEAAKYEASMIKSLAKYKNITQLRS